MWLWRKALPICLAERTGQTDGENVQADSAQNGRTAEQLEGAGVRRQNLGLAHPGTIVGGGEEGAEAEWGEVCG